MKLYLFNGAKTKDAWNEDSPHFIDDWKPEKKIIECDKVQVTYGQHLKAFLNSECILDLFWNDDLIEHKGIFYGDFIVSDLKS